MIEVKEMQKTFYMGTIEVHALRGVSFVVEEGEFVAIMGPSGSGKSTLMHLMGCLDYPTAGEYWIEGREISSISDDRLAEIRNQKIGFVFQQFNLLSRTTILQNVEVPLIYRGVGLRRRRQMAREALERVGLGHRLTHQPNEISGGQKQRVAIARALVNNPAIILADEPTGNLDSVTGGEIMDIFENLNKQGHTIILVTHEEEIAREARRIIELRDGEVLRDEVVA